MATNWDQVRDQEDYNRAKNWTGFGQAPNDGGYYQEQADIAKATEEAAKEAAKNAAKYRTVPGRQSKPKLSPPAVGGGSGYSRDGSGSGLGADALAEYLYRKNLAGKQREYDEGREDDKLEWQNNEDKIYNEFQAKNLEQSLKDDTYNAYARMLVSHYG